MPAHSSSGMRAGFLHPFLCYVEDLSIALKVFKHTNKNAVYEFPLQVTSSNFKANKFRRVLMRSRISTPEVQSGSFFAAVLQLSREN